MSRKIRNFFLASLVALAVVQGWACRFFEFNNDGISYLDIADHLLRRDWAGAVCCHWNLLYPGFLALVLAVVHPSPYWLFATLKLANLLIFFFLLLAAEIFLSQFLRSYKAQLRTTSSFALSEQMWIVLFYSTFSWCFLTMGGIFSDTPDMLMSSLLLISISVYLKIREEPALLANHVLLGFYLGTAYIAKAVALPIMLVLFALLALEIAPWRRYGKNFLIGIMIAGLLTLPLMMYVSERWGGTNRADPAKLFYLWSVRGRGGDINLSPELVHPIRRIVRHPRTDEFATPLEATFPVWFDPGYWYQGVKVEFSPFSSMIALVCNLFYYTSLFFALYLCALLVVFKEARHNLFTVRSWWKNAVFLIPAIVAFAIYAAVANLNLDPGNHRYFPVFILLFFIGTFASLRLPDSPRSGKAVSMAVCLIFAFALFQSGRQLLHDLKQSLADQNFVHYKVAQDLYQLGIRTGDRVARLGDFEVLVDWAKLGGFRIGAEIWSPDEYWRCTQAERAACLDRLRQYNIKAVVYFPHPVTQISDLLHNFFQKSVEHNLRSIGVQIAPAPRSVEQGPPPLPDEGWRKLKDADCYVFIL